jgi:hypothetical protein
MPLARLAPQGEAGPFRPRPGADDQAIAPAFGREGREVVLRRRGVLAAALGAAVAARPSRAASSSLLVTGVMDIDTRRLGFGGLSGLVVGDAGEGGVLPLWAVSDRGGWVEATLRLDGGLGPRSLEIRRTGRLADAQGRPLQGEWTDAEALARLPDGRFLVAFERQHRLWLYDTLASPARPFPTPPGLAEAPRNGGIEALAVLPGGHILALTESLPAGSGWRRGWIGRFASGGVAWRPLAYRPEQGLEPTAAAALPDGQVLVVERGFSLLGGFSGRVAMLPAAGGEALEGPEVLRFPGDLPAENWEGAAVARLGRRLIAAFLSDDNEYPLQRSLLALAQIA